MDKPYVIGVTATTDSQEEMLEGELMHSFFDGCIHDSQLALKPRAGVHNADDDEPELINLT